MVGFCHGGNLLGNHHNHHQISTTIDVIIIIITAIIVTIIILAALELKGLIGLEANSRSGPLHSIPCLVLIVFAVLFLCLPMSCFVSCAHNLPTVCSCTQCGVWCAVHSLVR